MPRLLPKDQLERFIITLVDWVSQDARDKLEWEASHCDGPALESPIEQAFHLAWTAFCMVTDCQSFVLQRQLKVRAGGNNYRLDFAWVDEKHGIKIAVELDGHEFHERTRGQVDSRNKRDAALQSAGWVVMHFSGHRILSEPNACCIEVHETACDAYYRAAYAAARRGGHNAVDSH